MVFEKILLNKPRIKAWLL